MILIFFLVFMLGFAVMFFGAISGGVGLVTRPVLIFLGFPASTVIATSRTAFIGEWSGLFLLHKNKHIDWKIASFLIFPMAIGSIIASIAAVTVLRTSIDKILGVLLLVIGIFFLFRNTLGVTERLRKFSEIKVKIISFLGTLCVSFFGTISGGLGPVYSYLYIWLYGKSFISSSATWRIASNISSIFSAIIFVISGTVDWLLFVALAAGFAFGSYFGTKYGLKQGETWVRWITLIVTFAGAVKLLFF